MTSLTIWAESGFPPASEGITALWQSFLPAGAPSHWHSLPSEVQGNRDDLRAEYLAWMHDVGQFQKGGVALVDRMAIRTGLSYWWMTIPADLSLEPNSPAYVSVRLIALARLADRHGITAVHVVTRDPARRRLFRDWARASHRQFSSSRPGRGASKSGHRLRKAREAIYRAMPPVGAVRILVAHVGLPRRRREPAPQGAAPSGIAVVDYLAHLGPQALFDGHFESNYWGPLVGLLEESPEPVTYLHVSAEMATPRVIDRDFATIDRFNSRSRVAHHDLMHADVSWRVLMRSCRDYFRIVRMGLSARAEAFASGSGRNDPPLWPAFRTSFRDQFYGRTAMLNCLWINIIEHSLERMPHQRLGIYLFENQPWEMAFVHAWRAAAHGDLVGVIHSTALFWSTRLFKDPRDAWAGAGANPMPWPDRVAVNSPVTRAACVSGHYPPERLVDAEALRYFALNGFPVRRHSEANANPQGVLRVVVLGEYSPAADRHLVRVVESALDRAGGPMDVVLRRHPTAPQSGESLDPRIRPAQRETLAELLDWADVAVCGALTSVAVEVACLGIPTILVCDADVFMSSPAEGMRGVAFAVNAAELAKALDGHAASRSLATNPRQDVFFLNAGLPRWKALLDHGMDGENRRREATQAAKSDNPIEP